MGARRGNRLAVRHGATSRQVGPLARNHRRRILRRLGTSPRDLDAIGRGYLDLYCRLLAKIDLCDRYVEANGLLRPDGAPQPLMKMYVSLVNSARLTIGKLEDHLGQRIEASPLAILEGEGRRVRLEAEERLRKAG